MTEKDLEKKKAELLRKLDEEPPFDKEQFEAEMKIGKMYEWAQMQEDGVIEISNSHWMPNGIHGHGTSQAAPGDSDYEEIRARHKLEKPGDTSSIWKSLVNGVWVSDSDNLGETNFLSE